MKPNMKLYDVTFTTSFCINANSRDEAEQAGWERLSENEKIRYEVEVFLLGDLNTTPES
jgi:hypothetical protein